MGGARYRWAIRLVGIIVFVFIVTTKVDVTKTLRILWRANFYYIALSAAMVVPLVAIKAWRWRVILSSLGVELSLGNCWRLYAIGLAAGFITPGQLGDAVKALYLRDMGHGLGIPLLSVVLDRLLDLLVLVLLACSGIFVFWEDFQGQFRALVALLGGIISLLFIVINKEWRGFFVERALPYLVPERAKEMTGLQSSGQPCGGISVGRASLALNLGITFLAFAISLSRLYLLVLSLGMEIGWLPFVASMSLASVVSLIPISVAGIGTRDAALIVTFSQLGLSSELAVSLSALILLLYVLNGIVGFLVWLKHPLNMTYS